MSTTPCEFGEIVIVKFFPFTNQVEFKRRPAVVISSQAYNARRPDAIMMAVPSQVHKISSFGELLIREWQEANLSKPSAIKPVLFTIEQSLILHAIGRLQAADLAALRSSISNLIG
jgi:mRNA interferase MazF